MSIFLERKLTLPRQIAGVPVVLTWHPSLGIFANCSYNDQLTSGSVSVFDSTGAFQQKFGVKSRSSYPEAAAWHPTKRLLVVAWRDGKLLSYDLESDGVQEGLPSASPILTLFWCAEGSFPLAAVEKANRVLLWNTGQATSKSSHVYEVPQSVTFFTFLQLQRVDGAGRDRLADSLTPVITLHGKANFLIGCQEGGVFHLTEHGILTEVLHLTEPIRSMSYFQTPGSRNRSAYIVTDGLRVLRYQITAADVFEEKLTMVLVGKTPASSLCWLDTETLAVAAVESVIRVWDLPKEQHTELSIRQCSTTEASEVVRTISVNPVFGTVVGATNTGNVLFWSVKMKPATSKDKTRQLIGWPISSANLQSELRTILPNRSGGEFLGASQKSIYLFQQRPLACSAAYPLIAVQTASNTLAVTDDTSNLVLTHKTKFSIAGCAVAERLVVVWGEEQVSVCSLSPTGTLTEAGSFSRDFVGIGVYSGNLIAAKNSSLAVLSSKGVPGKSDLRILPSEGSPTTMDICSRFCVVGTSLGYLKLADLDKIDLKHWVRSKSVKDSAPLFARFTGVRVNRDASFVAFLVENVEKNGETRTVSGIYVWDIERDTILFFDCAPEGNSLQKDIAGLTRRKISGMTPVGLVWEAKDPRLLCVHFTVATSTTSGLRLSAQYVATFYPSSEKGLLLNSVLEMTDDGPFLLLCCAIPHIFLYSCSVQHGQLAVVQRFLPDFDGFQPNNLDDLKAISDFCYYSALGKISIALNTVKTTNATLVWNHLARLCVRLGKLEYAKICLSKLGRADILADLRSFAQRHPEHGLQLGHLASLLQLKDVALTYFADGNVSELVLELNAAAGDWTGVLERLSTSTFDRLRRRETLFSMAVNDISFGCVDDAIQKLAQANCEKFDIPRLLLSKRPDELKHYVDSASDRKLYGWYGRFLETQGQTDEAVEYYTKAGDLKSVVRTMSDSEDEAIKLVRTSRDRSAAFQLAHTLEVDGSGDPQILIELYETAAAYPSAIRICMEHGLDDKLVQLATKSEKAEMLTAAKYLEGKGLADKAISLFHRAGQLGKATDLAFEQGYYGNIETISEDIDENSDPVLVERCVAYFAEHNQVDRAVNLLLKAKRLLEAVDLCVRHQMTIDGRLINLVLEISSTSVTSATERVTVLQQLADCCSKQGLYHEAARLLIEIKRPEAAMHALVKTGDIEAILRYIRIIRDPDALIVAGNNLQAHAWHQKKEIFDAIVLAYKRAGAHLYLASFYDSWGETACESGRYDVATEAFGKSFDVLGSVATSKENINDVEAAKQEMDTKRKVVSYFLEIQREAETAPEGAITSAEELLKHTKWETGLRSGHVLAFLISAAVAVGALPRAKKYLRKLKDECPGGHSVADFVGEDILHSLQ